jgi:type I restriction enzyme, S subunit
MQELVKSKRGYKIVHDFFKRAFEIPGNWEYPKFSTIVEVNPRTKIHSKVLYIPMEAVNIEKGSVDCFEERNADENTSLPKFQENDVLFARITPSTENGKVCLIENFSGQGIASSELTVLRATDKVIPRYLFYYVQTHRIKQFAISQMMGTTGRQRVPDFVFKKDLNFELPPLYEQQKIAAILSKVDELIQKTDQVIEQTQRNWTY